jgi:hypothetical protein
MLKNKIPGIFIILIFIIALPLGAAGCFSDSNNGNSNTPTSGGTGTPSGIVLTPDPEVVNVIASTSGTPDAYYSTLDIKVRNNGAEGIILISAAITQGDDTQTRETEVFLKQGAEYELKMTFPLEWKGGEISTDVTATVP